MHVEIGDIDVYRIGNLSRFTADLDLAYDLFQHALLLFDADRLANQVKRHRHFDLLSLYQPGEIRMNETTLNRIDLTIVKGVDLLPYINAGASISATASGHAPAGTVTYDGSVTVTVHI